jgi:hypothetical protein
MELKSVTYISDWSRNCPFLMILGQSLKGAVIDVALLATHSYKQNSLLSDVRLARSLYFICACRQERLEEAMAGNKKAINGRQRSLVILAIVNQIFLRLGFTFLHCWCLFPVRKTLVNRHVLSPSLHRAARSQPGSVSIRLRLGLRLELRLGLVLGLRLGSIVGLDLGQARAGSNSGMLGYS